MTLTGPDAALLAAAHRRGKIASLVALPLAAAGVPLAVWAPAGITAFVLLVPLLVAGQAVVAERRRPGAARDRAVPRVAWAMCGVALVAGVVFGLVSFTFTSFFVTPDECVMVPPGGNLPASCDQAGAGESAGVAAWTGVMGVVFVLLIGCALLARRSRTVAWAAVPLVLSGCVMAFDVAHLASALAG